MIQHAARPNRLLSAALAVTMALFLTVSATEASAGGRGNHTATVATNGPLSLAQVAEAIGADDLHGRGLTGAGVGVALIDTGVVPVPGLDGPGKVINGPDLSFESQIAALRYLDTYGHGTHIAGIIAGTWIDDSSRGLAPGAHLVNVKIAGHDGAVDVTQAIAAIDWTVAHADELGIRIINLSYGTTGVQPVEVDPLAAAVGRAWDAGIVVVVAAGNEGFGSPSLNAPATHPRVIAAGAADLRDTSTTDDDIVALFSSTGDRTRHPDVVAPGTSVTSLRNPGSTIDTEHASARVGDALFLGSGSSQAAAVVSGAIALLIEDNPQLQPEQVNQLLRTTSANLLHADRRSRGQGMIDISRAAARDVSDGAREAFTHLGTGSLEASRNGEHVAHDEVELDTEVDIHGATWVGTNHAWDGGVYRGVRWTGDCFCTDSFAGPAWSPAMWSTSFTGQEWGSADEFSGRSWSGRSWSGRSWSGRSWSGRSWSGRSWSGRSWSTGAWR